MPVARFIGMHEAYPMAGRLRAEGIDAKVLAQSETMYPYTPQGLVAYQIVVPERDGARATWILSHLRGEQPDKVEDGGP